MSTLLFVIFVMDNQWATKTIRILAAVMRMPPKGSAWVGREPISERTTRRNWTLSSASRAIHRVGTMLELAMKMQASGFVSQRVVNIHDDCIPLVGLNHRRRPLAVDGNYGTGC